MKRRTRNILAVIFAGLVLIAVLSALLHGPTQASVQMTSYAQMPSIFATGVSYGKQTIVASNGRSFVSYNYQTGKESLLSPDNLTSDLENIDKQLIVSPDERYIAFHVSLSPSGSALYTQLQNAKSDVTKSYWWLYDTQTKAFNPFPQSTVAVRFMGGKAYALTNLYGQETVQTYAPATFTATQNVSVPSASNLFVTGNEFWLQSGSNVLQTTDGTVSTTLFSGMTVLNVSPDGSSALLQDTKNSQYVLYDLATQKQTVIGDSSGGQVSWDASNDVLFGKVSTTKNNQSYTLFNDASKKTSSVAAYNLATKLITLLDAQTALVSDGTDIYIIGSGVHAGQPIPDAYSKLVAVGGKYVNVQYFSSQTAFIITLNKSNAGAEQTAVYGQLQQDGFNPDLFEIRFSLFTPPTAFN